MHIKLGQKYYFNLCFEVQKIDKFTINIMILASKNKFLNERQNYSI